MVVASLLARLTLDPLLGGGTQFSAFYVAVAVAAYAGGTRAAVLAAILSAIAADYWFLGQTRRLDFTLPTAVAQVLFLFVSSCFITTVHVLRGTQRKLEREADELDKQRRWFQVTFSSIGDGVITTDTDGRVTFINPAAEAMTGWKQSDAAGKPVETVFNIISAVTRLPAANPVREVLQTGKVVQLANHTTLIGKTGREIAIEDSAAPIRDGSGRGLGAVMVFHNVTERRKALDALHHSENRKSAILQASLDAIVTMDHEGRVVDFNRAAERIFGYRNDQAIGEELATLIIPERYRERHRQGMARYLTTGESRVFNQRLELSALRSDGHEFPAELSISTIPGDTPPMFSATLRDITERKKAEQALRESEERFRAAFDQAAVGIAISNIDGRLIEMNAKAVELFGYSTAELQRRTFFDVTHPDDIAPTREQVRRLLAGETRFYVLEKRYLRKDRSIVWSMTTVTLLKSAEGTPNKMIGILEDITARKKAEEALRASETFNRMIIESSRDCIKTLAIDGVLLWMSEAGRKVMGVSDLNAIVGKSYIDFWQGDDRAAARAAVETAARGGTGNLVAHFAVAGKSSWWDVVVTPIRDASGRVEKLLAVSRNITERKEVADALRENEAVLRVVTNESQVGLVMVDSERRYLFANATYAKVLGLGSAPIVGKRVSDVVPGLYDQISPHLDRAFAGERVASEQRMPAADGSAEQVYEVIYEPRKTGSADAYVVVVLVDITRRKQAEEALRRREEELRAMADSIPQLAWMAHPDGHIFWYNRRWFEYTGTTLEQMQGWGWQSVHDPAILPSVIERWSASIASGNPFDMEFPLRGADGIFRWFLTRVNPLRDEEGQVVRWFGTNTNVDDVRRAREALQEETRVLELLHKTGTAIASKLDLHSVVQTVTDAATELSGAKFGAFFYNTLNEQGEALLLYTLSGAPREAFERFGLPRNTPVFSPTFHNAGIVRSADITKDPRYGQMAPHHGMPKGHLPVCSYLAVPVVSRSGEVIGGLFFGHPEPNVFTERSERLVAGVAAQAAIAIDNARLYEGAQREINQRRRAEAELRESETRLRVSLDASALGTWEYNPKESVVLLDVRCQELFGMPGRSQIDLKTFFEVAHPEDRARREHKFREALQPTGSHRYEIEYRSAGFPPRWLRTAGRVFFNESGDPVRFVTAVFDITDMVNARETLAERRRELEELVAVRTESFQQAVAQMEEFSYSVSHDLRAPLRAIQGYAEALVQDYDERLDDVGRSYLQRIASAAQRMDRLTLDVLTYSKIGRDAMQLERVSLDKVVSETVEQYVNYLAAPSRVAVERPLLDVVAHEPMLVQAVSNLVTNALKFVRPGEIPEIKIRTERRGGEVRLWVEDRGIGIPAASQARIWGMFERIHPQALYDGTGIGLAIVRKALERMNGSLGVESDGTSGSKFWIQLPGANESENS